MASRPSRKFQELLLNFSQSEEMSERHKIEDTLWGEYGAVYAVFVLDMSGFSLLTRKYGIVHYLSMVRRMHEDCFGDPVNRASKMGEDLAAAGEILITKEAMQMIPAEAGIKAHEMNVSISGITIPAYMIEYRNEDKTFA